MTKNVVAIDSSDKMRVELKSMLGVCKSDGCVIVFNFAVWCGACQAFMPEWNKFQSKYSKSVDRIYKVESKSYTQELRQSDPQAFNTLTANGELYFPMVIIFVYGKKHLYDGSRTAEDLASFIKGKKAATSTPAPAKRVAKAPSKPAAGESRRIQEAKKTLQAIFG
jgi:thiol-disulfide isomerase/thioredoxin